MNSIHGKKEEQRLKREMSEGGNEGVTELAGGAFSPSSPHRWLLQYPYFTKKATQLLFLSFFFSQKSQAQLKPQHRKCFMKHSWVHGTARPSKDPLL